MNNSLCPYYLLRNNIILLFFITYSASNSMHANPRVKSSRHPKSNLCSLFTKSFRIKGPRRPTSYQSSSPLAHKNLYHGRTPMASWTVFHSVLLMEPWRPLHVVRNFSSVLCAKSEPCSTWKLSHGFGGATARGFRFSRKSSISCSADEILPSCSEDDEEQGPPQEAVLKAISGLL